MDIIENTACFEEAIKKAADAEINSLLSDARKKAEEAVRCADEEYLERCFHVVSGEAKKIKRQLEHEVSQREFEASKEIFSHRSERVGELFAEIEKEIIDFSRTSEYEKRLISLAEETERDNPFGENTVIYVKSDDVDKLKKRYPKITVSADKKIRLGGISVYYPEKSVFIDKTFDNAYERQKEEFVSNRIMQL